MKTPDTFGVRRLDAAFLRSLSAAGSAHADGREPGRRQSATLQKRAAGGTAFPTVGSRGVERVFAVALAFLVVTLAQAHEFGDDYGDTPGSAVTVGIGGSLTGRIEIDVDEDWFKFQVQSLKQYTVSVRTNTLWNSTVALVGVDGLTQMAFTDSVFSATATISRVHIGPTATWYARVGGFAQFTTGTYTIAVSSNAFVDLDQDGMPDAWENAYFGSTNAAPYGVNGDADTDACPNYVEFIAGTNPTNPLSLFEITAFEYGTNQSGTVTWPVQPYRFYQPEWATNLIGTSWQPLVVVTNMNGAGVMTYTDPGASNSPRFYRVECLY